MGLTWDGRIEAGDVVSAFGLVATILLAFLGYLISHASNMRRARLTAQVAYVSQQLQRLYGPLYALTESNTASWLVFRKTFRPDKKLFDRQKPFDERERAIWRSWAENVFIPSNLKIRDVIEQNAHLLSGEIMPDCFRDMIAHVESSKLVLASLADGDLDVLDQFPTWPKNFNGFVRDRYDAVAAEHARLLGRAHGRVRLRAPPEAGETTA